MYDSFNSLERILEGHQELSKEVLKKFGGHVEFNRCNEKVVEPYCGFGYISLFSDPN